MHLRREKGRPRSEDGELQLARTALRSVFDTLRGSGRVSVQRIQQLAQQNTSLEDFTGGLLEIVGSSQGRDRPTLTTFEHAPGSRWPPGAASTLSSSSGDWYSEQQAGSSHAPASGYEWHPALRLRSGAIGSATAYARNPDDQTAAWSRGATVRDFGNLAMSSAVKANGYPPIVQAQQLANFQVNEHSVPSLHIHEDSPLARAYTSFRDGALQMIASGTRAPEILGSDDIDVELFFRGRTIYDSVTVSSWAAELVRVVFQDIDFDIYVFLGTIALWTYLMQVCRCRPVSQSPSKVLGICFPGAGNALAATNLSLP